jgi:uncharacterized protein
MNPSLEIAKQIQEELQNLEQDLQVRVLYACESGSRAWGFASQNSDYDVRFVYIHRPEWYLSIQDRRDVIERTFENNLDVAGWDIRKDLTLFRKSNPPLLEWIQSPIVYQQDKQFLESLRSLVPRYYSPRSCMHHYLNMAQGNFREYLKGDTVWLKKYFYVLRPVLACMWIEQHKEPVPIEFSKLVDTLIPSKLLKQEITKLLEQKTQGQELDRGPKIKAISEFIEDQLERLGAKLAAKVDDLPIEPLNDLFRKTLERVWN